jgi:carbon-monoxide dehydrogenase medium subunit
MKPATFEYDDPTTVAEATAVLAEHGDEAKVLAGGQSLVPMLALRLARFQRLVDLNGVIELQAIERRDHEVRVGAMVRQATAEHDGVIAAGVPLLSRALPHIGHFQIRNRGTVGGSTAHADPASELPAVALALDAELELAGPRGTRAVAAKDFFVSMWTTTIADDELLTAIRYPVWTGRCGFAVEELARRRGDFALAGVACGVTVDGDDRVSRAAIGLFGMGATPVRATTAEQALIGQPAAGADLAAIGILAADAAEPIDDIHAPASYRRKVGAHLVQRALGVALREALDG